MPRICPRILWDESLEVAFGTAISEVSTQLGQLLQYTLALNSSIVASASRTMSTYFMGLLMLRSLAKAQCQVLGSLPRSTRAARRFPRPASAMQRQLMSSISLTQLEHDLFNMLKAVLITQALHDTQLRCAGGWVRDKLLGKDSHDIDIALNNMMGEEFAQHVNSHLTERSEKLGKVGEG